ncbi:Moderate conductance mechanosensitive channel YbiO precursor [Corynebacterium occultum]|uniref:Moderate conductance mechanosensitive channel YbiO n=1 Tax=Corynebacterium occultum TaxID=2675219 RepID=A0A6B8VYI6_9CORY|nr:mechanosensitive ion channel family protein [Corynebacterium occultum]QGU08099.1 Moderate conductance mechanosensitive channel YbiO precursor [Corynebacterium occultum]
MTISTENTPASENPDSPELSPTTLGESVSEATDWWQQPTTQEWLIQKPIEILLTIIVALVMHWLARRGIDKLARRNINARFKAPRLPGKLGRRPNAPEEIPPHVAAMNRAHEDRRKARIRTLAAVGKSAAGILIWAWAVLAMLQTVNINVGPIIASAGVIGLAIGFGAQSLVKDFLSGIFMLLEDQYGVGDTVDLGEGIVGDVEDISLRLTTLRDIDGTVWYVRNGEILRVGNLSDDFSIARLQVPVGLSNDSEEAWNVILDSVNRGVEEERIREGVIEEPVMNGVTDFQPDHISYRISVKTLPGRQWEVQRFLQARVLNDMREAGITTPYPHGIGGISRENYDV